MDSSSVSKPISGLKVPSRSKVRVIGMTLDPPGATYGPRHEDHHEFIWIMEGEVLAHFNKRVLHAGAGTILLKRPWVKDYYEWSTQHRTVHAYVHFDLDDVQRRKLSQPQVPVFRQLPPNNLFQPLFSYILNLGDKPEPLRTELMLSVLNLMVESYASGELELRTQPAIQLNEAVQRAIEVIHYHTSHESPSPLTLTALAQAAHTTPANLCRLFKKALDLRPLEYSKLMRLDKAARQLRQSTLSLKEIGLSNGFYDAYHFSRSFKNVYGVSPKDYRESKDADGIAKKNPIIRVLYERV